MTMRWLIFARLDKNGADQQHHLKKDKHATQKKRPKPLVKLGRGFEAIEAD